MAEPSIQLKSCGCSAGAIPCFIPYLEANAGQWNANHVAFFYSRHPLAVRMWFRGYSKARQQDQMAQEVVRLIRDWDSRMSSPFNDGFIAALSLLQGPSYENDGSGSDKSGVSVDGSGNDKSGAGVDGSGNDKSGVGVDGSGNDKSGVGVDGSGNDKSGVGVDGSGNDKSGVGVDGSGNDNSSIGVDGKDIELFNDLRGVAWVYSRPSTY